MDREGMMADRAPNGKGEEAREIIGNLSLARKIYLSKQHLECIWDAIPHAMFAVDADHRLTRINRAYAERVGEGFQDILGTPCYEKLYRRNEPCRNCPLKSVQEKHEQTTFTVELDDGTVFRTQCFPLSEKSGELAGMVEYVQDMTDASRIRHKARSSPAKKPYVPDRTEEETWEVVKDQSLAEKIYLSKRHLECIYDSIPHPMFTVGSDYRLTRINRSYTKRVGKKFQDILGAPCYTQLYRRDKPCRDCPLHSVLAKREHKAYTVELDDGTIFDAQCFPLSEKSGEVVGLVEFAQDITREERMRRELAQAQQRLKEKTAKLQSEHRELKEAYGRINEEMEIARNVQQGIMPRRLPQLPEFDIAAYCHSMEAVGGDFYDFIPIEPDRLGMVIVDVSGHGIPAAFIAAMAKMSFFLHATRTLSAARVIEYVNKDMCNSLDISQYYFTTVCCIIDLITNRVSYSNGGHPPIAVFRSSTGTLEMPKAKGIIVGSFADAHFSDLTVELGRGDRLMAYTDGIYECTNADDKPFTRQRFLELLRKTSVLDAAQQIAEVKRELSNFLGSQEPSDDMSLVVLNTLMDNKFKQLDLHEEFGEAEGVEITAARQPLQFDQIIAGVLRRMSACSFADTDIRSFRRALSQAIHLHWSRRPNGGEPVYLACRCTTDECTVVIADASTDVSGGDGESKSAHATIEETIRNNTDTFENRGGGGKILLKKLKQ